jgi:hypothetical protein
LNDLSDSCELLEEFLLNDRLIENINIYQEMQENLISTFQTKIDNINYDIEFIQSKKIKSDLSDIKEQNEQINNLLRNVLSINSVFFRNAENEKREKEQAKPLYDEMRKGLNVLEEIISEYNQKAEQNKSEKLIAIKEARENAVQELKSYLDNDFNWIL